MRRHTLVGSIAILTAACSDDGLPQNSDTDAASATSTVTGEETLPPTSMSGSGGESMTSGSESSSVTDTASATIGSSGPADTGSTSGTDASTDSTGSSDATGDSSSSGDSSGSGGESSSSSSSGGESGTSSSSSSGGLEVFDVSFCRLQFPLLIDEDAGTEVTMYGRFYAEGLTDIDAFNNPHPSVRGYVGYGGDGTDPADNQSWVWIEALPNPGWDGNVFGEPNNDEYWLDMTVPAAGMYDFAFRWTGDGGESFVYCDGDDSGSSNGYQIGQAGDMSSN